MSAKLIQLLSGTLGEARCQGPSLRMWSRINSYPKAKGCPLSRPLRLWKWGEKSIANSTEAGNARKKQKVVTKSQGFSIRVTKDDILTPPLPAGTVGK